MHWMRRHRRGRPPHPDVLTPAEWRVVDLARAGRSNPEIAEELGITVPTVKTHMSRILDKLGLPDRRALAAWEGQPAVEVPRRSGMLASLGWLTSKAAGGVAAVVFTSVLVGIFVVALDSGRVGADSETPSPTSIPTEHPEESGGMATASPTPDGQFAANGRFIPYPPEELLWLDKDGLITVPAWDDRQLTPEEKAADPWHDPRWPDLVRCLRGAGLGAGLPDPDEFRQADLDRLVATINEDGPFLVSDASGLRYIGTPESDAFIACAQRVLAAAS